MNLLQKSEWRMNQINRTRTTLLLAGLLFHSHVTVANAEQTADQKPQDAAEAPAVNYCEIWAMDADGRNARKVAHVPDYPIINSPEISHDGTRVAVDGWKTGENNADAVILIVDIKTGDVENHGKGCMPTWAPNGKSIALCKYGAERGVYIRSLDGKTEVRIDPQGWGIQWSPDGLKLAYTKGGQFIIYTSANDSWDIITPKDWNYDFIYWNPTWSPDSSRLCFKGRIARGRTEFAIVNIEGDEPVVQTRISAEGFNPDIAWHPDGKRIAIPQAAAAGQFGRMVEFNPDDVTEVGKQTGVPVKGQPNERHNGGMSWSRDGKTLFFISRK
jgi:TolB protein